MIVAAMLYAIIVSTLLTLAAALVAAGLRLYRRPVRWSWALALAGSVLWPAAALAGLTGIVSWPGGSVVRRLLSLGAAGGGTTGAPVALPGADVIAARGARPWLEVSALVPPAAETALVLAWGLASATLLGIVLRSWRKLQRRRSTWKRGRVAEIDVLLSGETGPAVMGVLRTAIVLPAWVRDLDPDRRELVVLHELEHLRAGDSRLLGIALLVVTLVPWNPLLWLQLHHLRLAVELDCDRRVLGRGTGPRRYGNFLMNVSGGSPDLPLPVTGFANAGTLLERRIRAMTSRVPRFRHLRALAVLTAAGGALALACDTPAPMGEAGPEVGAVDAEAGSADATPSFVARDVEPTISNSREIRDLLRERYPPLLRDAGIEGRVVLWLKVARSGTVEQARVQRPSDHEALNQAALEIGERMTFSPAEKDGEPIPVWIAQPITFRTTGGDAAAEDRAVGVDAADGGERRALRTPGRSIDTGGDAAPLVFIDDVQVTTGGEPLRPGRGGLAGLSSEEIEKVEIIKGDAARALYGDAARDGIIRITTKEGG